jgi:hypothetical protein
MLALFRSLSAAADCSKVPEKAKISGTRYKLSLSVRSSTSHNDRYICAENRIPLRL